MQVPVWSARGIRTSQYVRLCFVTVNQACVWDFKDFSRFCWMHTACIALAFFRANYEYWDVRVFDFMNIEMAVFDFMNIEMAVFDFMNIGMYEYWDGCFWFYEYWDGCFWPICCWLCCVQKCDPAFDLCFSDLCLIDRCKGTWNARFILSWPYTVDGTLNSKNQ